MKCPVCNTVDLVMSERNGIEIDYCPQCRGVWLDRGELDKIIERSTAVTASYAPPVSQPVYANHATQGHQQQSYHGQHDNHYPRKKREGFWGELFDFD